MQNKIVILCTLLSIFFLAYGQEPEKDTTGYISGDLDYNLIYSSYKGNKDEVIRLLKVGADVNGSLGNDVTPLMYATQEGYFDIVEILVLSGAEINKVPDNGITPLISAVIIDSLEIAEFLIRNGADVNLAGHHKATPLMQAIANGNYLMTDMLLYYGADITKKDIHGTDALMLASFLGLTDIASLLIDYGADVNSTDIKQRTPLHLAVQNGFIEVVELLIEKNAETERTDIAGYTPLGIAVMYNDLEMTRFLVSKGAKANHKISFSKNALTIARENKNDSIVDFLRNNNTRRIPWPGFNQFITGPDLNWNSDDLLTGIHFGISDWKYLIDIFAEYKFRPSAIPVLVKESDNVSYQFRERRGAYAVGADKKFLVISARNGIKYGFMLGCKETVTFGSYRGSSSTPVTRWLTVPRAGIYMNYRFLNAKLYYEYLKLDLYRINNARFNFSIYFNINRKKNTYAPKYINWL
ncbi:MAG: ankyrin repeat domain-containing protein [Bacteroidales bacterium]|nr:ankyrin repeat domain-containing protein [Bacteroidales bacterium]